MRIVVPRALAGERLDRAVATITGLSRSDVEDLVAGGGVLLEGRRVQRSRRVLEGEVIDVELAESRAGGETPLPPPEVPVLFADEEVVVVDKPAGVVVHHGSGHRSGTLVDRLVTRFPDLAGVGDPSRPGIVQRLDKGTSGLMVVARTNRSYKDLVAQIRARRVERRYLALAEGRVEAEAGVIDAPVGRSERVRTAMSVSASGRPARTRFRVRARYEVPAAATLLQCDLETGRTHQIRVHLAAVGHPLAGDSRYGSGRSLGLGRPFLHAYHLAFRHPGTGELLELESGLPAELGEILGRLR